MPEGGSDDRNLPAIPIDVKNITRRPYGLLHCLTPEGGPGYYAPMPRRVAQAKALARRQCLQVRRDLGANPLEMASAAIVTRVVGLNAWSGSRTVHTYVDSMAGEVHTNGLILQALHQGKRVVVPVVPADRQRRLLHAEITSPEEQLTVGPLGLRQPPEQQAEFDDFESIDLVIVPGLAFSPNGDRLGMGGGYYDRFLAGLAVIKVGLVCRQLLLDSVPSTSHDISMDWVITEDAVYDCQQPDERERRE